jgi:hypothetical protein
MTSFRRLRSDTPRDLASQIQQISVNQADNDDMQVESVKSRNVRCGVFLFDFSYFFIICFGCVFENPHTLIVGSGICLS